MKPYWQSDDGAIVVYCARYEDVLAAGVVDVPRVALVHDDPPYGVGEQTDRKSRGRGDPEWLKRGARRYDFPPVAGDDRPFDPSPILALDRPAVIWGGNYHAALLPMSPSWILWDKREDITPDDNADGELAWTNLGGPLRVFRHWWRGALRKTEKEDKHLHPTQKPIALCSYVYQRARLKPGDLVFVPHGGSGPDLPACRAAGLRLIWCDVERWCCDTAIARLGAVTRERAAEPAGPLFSRPLEARP